MDAIGKQIRGKAGTGERASGLLIGSPDDGGADIAVLGVIGRAGEVHAGPGGEGSSVDGAGDGYTVGTVSDTVTVMVSTTTFPRKSVIVAVIVWTPSISRSVERLEPVAEPTCRSDVQTMSSLMSPSSASVAVPWRVTMEPELKTEPSAGPSPDHLWRERVGYRTR